MRPRAQAGFSLIEVLVTLVIFSLGLIGLASLQLIGLSANHGATLRTTATYLAYDMADRVRANAVGAKALNYSNVAGADGSCQAAHFGDVHATPTACTPANLALDDIYDWKQAIAAQLPGGSGIVCIDSTPNDTACDGLGTAYAVKVRWTDKPKAEASVVRQISVGFRP